MIDSVPAKPLRTVTAEDHHACRCRESVAMSTIGVGAQAFVSVHNGGRDTNQYRVGQVPDNGK